MKAFEERPLMIWNDGHIWSKHKQKKCPKGAQDKAAENLSQIHNSFTVGLRPASLLLLGKSTAVSVMT